MKAAWAFFATSNGRSPCDGVGGTVKRFTAMESLRRPFYNLIFSVDAMMAYSQVILPKFPFLYCHQKNFYNNELNWNKDFKKLRQLKKLVPINLIGATRLGMKHISDDKQFSLEADIISLREDIPAQNTNIGQYVSASFM